MNNLKMMLVQSLTNIIVSKKSSRVEQMVLKEAVREMFTNYLILMMENSEGNSEKVLECYESAFDEPLSEANVLD